MNFIESVRAITRSSGSGPIDWTAAAEAAKTSTDPGSLSLSDAEREAYAADVRAARDAVGAATDSPFEVPDSIQILDRHHWIDANVATFERIMAPVETSAERIPGIARTINTGTMAVTLAFLGRNVLGQYDPVLLAEDPHELYFVHPNIVRVAEVLDVPVDRFRRWIVFHEVTHAAEFGAAPWLPSYLESRLEGAVEDLTAGRLDAVAFAELDAAMTAVEGYAELLMDQAFDREYEDLRDALEQRRRSRGPIGQAMRRLLGIGMKRRQYERGKEFFETIANDRGIAGASAVWARPENLPTEAELDEPALWLKRVEA